jgi:hypothetical protein
VSPILVASLSVSTIQAEPTLNSVREQPDQQTLRPIEGDVRPITVPHRKATDAEAWEKFEAEFRPERRSSSSIKHQIESAKYGLDTTLFAVDRFVKSIRDHADFELDQGRLRHTRANPSGGFLDNPRVKLDLDMLRSKPYIGVRVVIPFGN